MSAELVAYVHGSRDPLTLGSLMQGGTLTVGVETYDIPPNTPRGDHPAGERVAAALDKAGYRLADDYIHAVEPPDDRGIYPVRVMKA